MKFIAYKTADNNDSSKGSLPDNYITEWRALTEQEIDNRAQLAKEGWKFMFENKFKKLLEECNSEESLITWKESKNNGTS